ncbi:MAG: hypothetical protein IPK25_09620 [Saprospiraceae bacterium]|nr:hypothetical protein [Saprospiraceae bacterium]
MILKSISSLEVRVMRAMYDGWNTRVETINKDLLFEGNKVKNVKIRLVDDVSTSLEKSVL